jgi:hypothetical protein
MWKHGCALKTFLPLREKESEEREYEDTGARGCGRALRLTTDDRGRVGREMTPIDINSDIYMDQGAFERGSQEWMEKNKETMQTDMRLIFLGIFVFIVSTGVLIYSEVRLVLIQREVDAKVIGAKDVGAETEEGLQDVGRMRAYLSLSSVGAMVVALWIGLFALCHMATEMLASMHYAFSGCYQMAFTVSFVIAAIWSLFVVGCCWLCTRPWTAGMCLMIALLGELAIDSGSAAAVVMWAVMAAGAAYLFFVYGPYFFSDGPQSKRERPLFRDPEK